MNHRHPTTALWAQVSDRKRQRLADKDSGEGVLRAYGHPLETVTSFKYLRFLLTAMDYDFTEVIFNLHKARKS